MVERSRPVARAAPTPDPPVGDPLPTAAAAPGSGALHERMVERYAPPSLLVDRRHEVVHLSARAGRYLRVPGGVPTRDVLRLVRPELRAELREALARAAGGEQVLRCRPVPLVIAGETRWVVLRVSPATDPELDGLVLVIFDEFDPMDGPGADAAATVRPRPEGGDAGFRAFVELVPDLLWRSDPEAHATWYNQRWVDYTGKTIESSLEFGWQEVIHPDDRPRALAAVDAASRSGEPFRVELRLRGVDGSYRWFLVQAFIVTDETGKPTEWLGAATDIHEQRTALALETAERVRAVAARREVLRRLVTAEEDERRRISRELHDQMGQLVTALLLGLRTLAEHPGAVMVAKQARGLESLAGRIARELRHLALELRPPALDNLGLRPALQSQLEEWSERHGVEIDFHTIGMEEERLPPELESTIYRVVQEGLTNIAKHADASHVSLLLERRGPSVRAILEDDGRGFDVERTLDSRGTAKQLGLRGMQERVALLGGELEIESSPGAGTTIFVRVQLSPPSAEGSP